MPKHGRPYHFPAHKPAKGCRGKAVLFTVIITGGVIPAILACYLIVTFSR
jgi:hypothetical protein